MQGDSPADFRLCGQLLGSPGSAFEQGSGDALPRAFGIDPDVANHFRVRVLGPDLAEACDLRIAAIDDPRVERKVGAGLRQPLAHLVDRLAPDPLVRKRAAPHERGEAIGVGERRSSKVVHLETPLRESFARLRREAKDVPERARLFHGTPPFLRTAL
jgi:hypothetical protein